MTKTYGPKDLAIALPLLLTPPLWGLTPDFIGPAILLLSAGVCFFLTCYPERAAAGKNYLPLACAAVCLLLLALSWWTLSTLKEQALIISVCLLYGVTLQRLCNQRQRRLIAYAIICGALLIALLALNIPLLIDNDKIDYIAMANPNILSLHLALCLPLGIRLCLQNKHPAERVFLAAICVILVITLFYKRSLGCAVALATGLSLFMPLPLTPRVRTALRCAAILAMVTVSYPFLNPKSTKMADRVYWQRQGYSIFKQRPLLGNAERGGFMARYPARRELQRPRINTTSTHNIFLQWLCDWGLAGTLALLMVLMILLPRYRHLKQDWSLQAMLTVAVIGGLWDSGLQMLPNLLVFCGLLGTSATVHGPARSKLTDKATIASIAILTLAASMQIVIARYHTLLGARYLTATASDLRALEKADSRFKRAVAWEPTNFQSWIDLSVTQALECRDDLLACDKAVIARRKACALMPNHDLLWHDLKRFLVFRDKMYTGSP
ncbi:MAG: O-antigen ligase family protein [Elusimicrobiota bacterium]